MNGDWLFIGFGILGALVLIALYPFVFPAEQPEDDNHEGAV